MRIVLLASIFLLGTAALRAGIIVDVTLDTSALVSDAAAGPFSIDLQMIDGSGTGDANNTITLSDFNFGGDASLGSASLFGGASGDLASGVSITDSGFFNEFTEAFTPGSALSFTLDFTTNVDSPAPDTFSLAIEDGTGTALPTMGLYSIGVDTFLYFQIDSSNPTIDTFASDTSRTPVAGGGPIDMNAPQVTPGAGGGGSPTPEPSSAFLAALGLATTLCLKRGSLSKPRRFAPKP